MGDSSKKGKKQPLLSIIIPVYNEERVIEECLRSLLKQRYEDVEIIVVDDGSKDGTVRVIRDIRDIRDIRVYEQKHKGPAQARNFGVSKAKGKILIFVDSDMTFDPKFLEMLVGPILEGKVKGTFSHEEYISNWENVWSRCWNYNRNFGFKKMHSENHSEEGTDFRAILKSEFERVGGFSDQGYTDSWTLFQKLGYRPKAAKGAIFYHKNPDNLAEIFTASKWMSKRDYKFWMLGTVIALIRNTLPFSLVIGSFKAIKFNTPQFLVFKVVFDLGGFLGILEKVFLGKLAK